MKLVVFSDLHLPYSGGLDYQIQLPDDCDAIVIAGDVDDPISRSMAWLRDNVAGQGKPIVYVAGNHEHYNQDYTKNMAEARSLAPTFANSGIHYLENEEVVIDGVRFLGCTLWTDFELYERPEAGMNTARLCMNDFRCITETPDGIRSVRFTPERTREIHKESLAWLEGALARPFDGKTIVVTHHCPHPLSIHRQYAGDSLNPAFTSDLDQTVQKFEPDLWIHGHTHSSFDYVVPGTTTRVVCNPRGYVRERFNGREVENMDFIRYLTIEV